MWFFFFLIFFNFYFKWFWFLYFLSFFLWLLFAFWVSLAEMAFLYLFIFSFSRFLSPTSKPTRAHSIAFIILLFYFNFWLLTLQATLSEMTSTALIFSINVHRSHQFAFILVLVRSLLLRLLWHGKKIKIKKKKRTEIYLIDLETFCYVYIKMLQRFYSCYYKDLADQT